METDQLTSRTRKYVELVAAGKSSVEAAKFAGFSDSYARVAAHRMKQNPIVTKAIEEIRKEGRSKAGYDLARAMTEAGEALNFSIKHKNPMAAVRAAELRA